MLWLVSIDVPLVYLTIKQTPELGTHLSSWFSKKKLNLEKYKLSKYLKIGL